jgi:hypothetical protein
LPSSGERAIMPVTSSMVQEGLLASGNAIWRAKINAEHNIQQAVWSTMTRGERLAGYRFS